MAQTHSRLSPLREIYCINCHEELILNLAERRGEVPIVCPRCKTSFNIKQAGLFMRSVSPIMEGRCPSCFEDLIFDLDDRIGNKKIKCPLCKDSFYIDEVESSQESTKIKNKPRNQEGYDIYSILKYYFPYIRREYNNYYIKVDKFNRKLFLNVLLILDLSLSLIISIVNKPTGIGSWNYTFGDWVVDFLGQALIGSLIPSLIIATIVGFAIKGERKLSPGEIEGYISRFNSRK